MQASLLGTITMWWAMSALGFSVLVFPFQTYIGFRSGMARPFAAALLIILAFLPFKVRLASCPPHSMQFGPACSRFPALSSMLPRREAWG